MKKMKAVENLSIEACWEKLMGQESVTARMMI